MAGLLQAGEVPRSEFPQPQFQREAWLTLNGPWEFEFDDANAGIKEDWPAAQKKFSREITVPFSFETPRSGIGDRSFHPYIWYRRAFEVPQAWRGQRVLLHFGAVDYLARVWINGRFAGEHRGGNVPFRLDITPLLKNGANAVVVRAEDQPRDQYMPRGKQYWEPKSRGIFYNRTSGIWQPVWLEAAGASYLEKVRITPANDGLVRFEAKIADPQPGLEFHAVVSRNGETVAATMARAAEDRSAAAANVQHAKLWSPSEPNLYDVTFELRAGGRVVDRVRSYFAFRSVTIENGRVAINHDPVYLKFVLDQGYWPESNLTPPSDEAIQFDIRATKDMGFNGARKHQKIEDPRFLYWADKLGFLVSGEIANAYRYDDTYVERITGEWIEAVERDYNHPSIIMWVPLNESWGVPNLADSRQQFHLRSLYALTRSLDSTRLVIDNDGWEHTEATDLMAIHDYTASGDAFERKYKDLGKPGAPVPDNHRPALAPGVKYNGAPVYLSEFGGIAYIHPGSAVPKEAWGYSGVEKTADSALARLRRIYQGIAVVPAIIGVCYTQLTDVEQEINGLMTYDRKLKFDPKTVREINALLHF
jgi:beta-galactosidase/beta-glucuronidase